MTNEELIALVDSAENALLLRKEEGPMIEQAIRALKEYWESEYQFYSENFRTNGYLEILKTQIIYICNPEYSDDQIAKIAQKCFNNVYAVIEFVILTDMYGTAPYYQIPYKGNSVVVYENGQIEVNDMSPIKAFQSNTFKYDADEFIESISDYGSEYNAVFELFE